MKKTLLFLLVMGLSMSAAGESAGAARDSVRQSPVFAGSAGWYPAAEPEQAVLSGLAEDGWEASYCSSVLWSEGVDMVIVDTLAYVSFYNGLYILNVKDPAQPTFVSQVYANGGTVYDVAVQGTYAYLPADDRHLYVVDI
ncbi:MAG: hypothetical protein GYA46_11235, partial [candidate division Zixibacteria bacterium]|nr:hypothetical protein [candidate division Zixibacteria bacterium]